MRKTEGKILYVCLSQSGLSFRTDAKERFFRFDDAVPPGENIRQGLTCAMKKAGRNISSVRICPDTLKTILVPGELSEPEAAQDYFRINGIDVEPSERLVISEIDDCGGKIATITAVNALWADIAGEVCGERAVFFSPFALNRPGSRNDRGAENDTDIYLAPHNAYISARESRSGRLVYWVALPYSSPADILYYLTELSSGLGIEADSLTIRGANCRKILSSLRKTFKNARCG